MLELSLAIESVITHLLIKFIFIALASAEAMRKQALYRTTSIRKSVVALKENQSHPDKLYHSGLSL